MSERIEYLAKSNAAYHILSYLNTVFVQNIKRDKNSNSCKNLDQKYWIEYEDFEEANGINIPSLIVDEVLTRFQKWEFIEEKHTLGKHGFVITEKGAKILEQYDQLLHTV